MSKWMQKVASVLLAVMMLLAAIPVWGVAETVTTPSDLPGVTEGPTEEPTEAPTEIPTEAPTEEPVEEVPTEEPTQEPTSVPTEEPPAEEGPVEEVPSEEPPVEEIPPLLVEDVVQPPLLMSEATAADELEPYGLFTENGEYYADFPDMIILYGGTFTTNQLNVEMLDVEGATLHICGEGNSAASMFSIGAGEVIMERGSSLSAPMSAYGGTVKIESGAHLDELDVGRRANVTIEDSASVGYLSYNGGTAKITGASIGTLHLGVTDGSLTTNGTTISALSFRAGDEVLPNIASNIAAKNIVINSGETAPETVRVPEHEGDALSISYGGVSLNGLSPNIYFEFIRKDAGPAGDAYTYTAKCHLGDGKIPSTCEVQVPVKKYNLIIDVLDQNTYVGTNIESINVGMTPKDLAPNHSIQKSCPVVYVNGQPTYGGTIDEPGDYDLSVEISCIIDDNTGEDVTSQYNITVIPGKLTVIEPSFTVTIPARVDASANPATLDVECDFLGYSSVTVDVSSAHDWMMYRDNNEKNEYITYLCSVPNAKSLNDRVVHFSFDASGKQTLTFTPFPGGNLPAGEYTDTLTFTVTAVSTAE